MCFSPSDLDADFEDNQDYDSTVSQSETKLPTFNPSLGGQSLPDAVGSQITKPAVTPADYAELRQVISKCKTFFCKTRAAAELDSSLCLSLIVGNVCSASVLCLHINEC